MHSQKNKKSIMEGYKNVQNGLQTIGENTKLVSASKQEFVEVDEEINENTLSERARMQRGMSKAFINDKLVSNARTFIERDKETFKEDHNFKEKTEYTFALPNIMNLDKSHDFKALVCEELIDNSVLVTLEQNGDLNWWVDYGICHRLYPYITNGDGNCLLHAASLAMWGFHDRNILRQVLFEDLSSSKFVGLKRRWRWQQMQSNKIIGLIMDENEWEIEWQNIVKMASANRLGDDDEQIEPDLTYKSLEEFHVFFLSHILRRPIIIISLPYLLDSSGAPLSPIPFGGIYLPLERAPEECCKFPLLLTYNLSHFSALVPMKDNELNNALDGIPLVNENFDLMEIHYSVDPGSKIKPINYDNVPALSDMQKMSIIMMYMDVEFLDKANKSKSIDVSIKKLSRNLDNITSEPSRSPGLIPKSQSAYRMTQSTRTNLNSLSPTLKQIPCVKLSHKRTPFYNDFIKNYLKDAETRFKQSRIQKRNQHDEIRRRSINGKFIFKDIPPKNSNNLYINNNKNLYKYDYSSNSYELKSDKKLVNKPYIDSNIVIDDNIKGKNCEFYNLEIHESNLHPESPTLHRKKKIDSETRPISQIFEQFFTKPKIEFKTIFKKPHKPLASGRSKFYTVTSPEQCRDEKIYISKIGDVHYFESQKSASYDDLSADSFGNQMFSSSNEISSLNKFEKKNCKFSANDLEYIHKNSDNLESVVRNHSPSASISPFNDFDKVLINRSKPMLNNIHSNIIHFEQQGIKSKNENNLCRTENCEFYGSKDTNFYCSTCFTKNKKIEKVEFTKNYSSNIGNECDSFNVKSEFTLNDNIENLNDCSNLNNFSHIKNMVKCNLTFSNEDLLSDIHKTNKKSHDLNKQLYSVNLNQDGFHKVAITTSFPTNLPTNDFGSTAAKMSNTDITRCLKCSRVINEKWNLCIDCISLDTHSKFAYNTAKTEF